MKTPLTTLFKKKQNTFKFRFTKGIIRTRKRTYYFSLRSWKM